MSKVTYKKVVEIFKNNPPTGHDFDELSYGLGIFLRYVCNAVCGVKKGYIYGPSVKHLINEGVTKEEFIKLSDCFWVIKKGHLCLRLLTL